MAEQGADDESFLGRWSRRKQALRAGKPLGTEPVVPDPEPPVPIEPAPAAQRTDVAAPTLEEAQALTPQSDFTRFAARGVTPEVKNAAMKKLFSDPHFNVMDGLDVYVDDYSRPDPMPSAMLKKLASAQFLRLFDEPAKDGPEKAPAAQDAGEDADTDARADMAQSPLCNDLPSQPGAPDAPASQPDDAHADLRLQPDHAASGKGPGRGTG